MTPPPQAPGEALTDAARALKILENMPGHAWSADAAGRLTYLSPNTLAFLGRVPENFDSWSEDEFVWGPLVHPDEYARVAATWRYCLQTGAHYNSEHRLRSADGTYRWFRDSGRPSRDGHGRITGWYGTTIEIEDHKQAQAALRVREREVSELVDMVPSHLWRLTPEGEPTFFNKRMVDFIGLDVGDTDKPGMSRLEAVLATVIHPDDAAEFRRTLGLSLSTGESFTARYRLRRADGLYRWMSSRAEPLRDEQGQIIQWYGLCHDVDDQVRADEVLRRSARQLQQLIDSVPALIWCVTPEGIPCYLSKRVVELTGITLKDLIGPDGSRSLAVVHPDDRDATDQALARSIETGEPFVRTYRQRRSAGLYRWVESRAEPLRDESGTIIQWYGVTVDIHDLVTAQEALRDRERELSQLADMVPVQIRRLTREGEPTFFNKRLLNFFGLDDVSQLDAPGMSRLAAAIRTLVHPEDSDRLLATVRHSVATGEPYSMKYRIRRADGVYRWVDGRGEPLRDQNGVILHWYAISIDIDDEVRFYRDIEEREAKIRRLVDSDIIGIVIWDLDGRVIDANDAFLRLVQYDRGDLSAGLRWFDITPPEWQEVHAREEAEELLSTGKMQPREKEYFRKDGTRVPVLIGAACFEGQSRQGVAYILDLTERKKAEAALRQREQELAQLVDMLPVYIRRLSPEGEPIFFNKRLAEFIGVALENISEVGASRLGPAIDNFVHPEEAPKVLAAVRRAIASGEGYVMKYRMRRADGVYRWMETRAEPLRNQDGTIAQWYSVSIDVDDEMRARHAEAALRETSDKLAKSSQAAGLAELSASIAHEVNQPLAAIVANAHACQRWLSIEPANVERAKITVERVIRDANSAAEVVSNIRALFRQSVSRRTLVPLSGAIDEARTLVAEEAARRGIRMEIEVQSELPLIAFDRVQVQQVLINLIRNGFDAMDGGAENRTLGVRAWKSGESIRIAISDHGPGIAQPEKIFEPFFTTKEQGMGMGLAICRSIVESHGGRLWIEKNDAHGATFVFSLPVGPDQPAGHTFTEPLASHVTGPEEFASATPAAPGAEAGPTSLSQPDLDGRH